MKTRSIGSLEVSVVGLGCNTLGSGFGTPVDEAASRDVVHAALDAGITLFDTADIYGESEVFLGRALAGRRDDVVIATKVGGRGSAGLHRMHGDRPARDSPVDERVGAGRRAIELGVEESLRRLGTDRIDLYQIHYPDPAVPPEETLSALDALVTAGKVREVGCSNFGAEQLREAAQLAATHGLRPYASLQGELSILRARPLGDELPACRDLGVAFIPYSPLANGLLSGKYRRDDGPPADSRFAHLDPATAERSLTTRTFDRLDRLQAFAAERDRTLLELAIGWLLALPEVASVITGATRPDQVRANAAAGARPLDPPDVPAALDAARAP